MDFPQAGPRTRERSSEEKGPGSAPCAHAEFEQSVRYRAAAHFKAAASSLIRRDGENGIDVIQRLQSEYNDDIPAVLVTGDTAPDHLKDAQESGLILLHKPVANIKLGATVGNLLRAPALP